MYREILHNKVVFQKAKHILHRYLDLRNILCTFMMIPKCPWVQITYFDLMQIHTKYEHTIHIFDFLNSIEQFPFRFIIIIDFINLPFSFMK